MRRAVALICSLVACGVVAPAASAGNPDTVVSATAPDEGTTVQRSGVVVGWDGDDTVDATNLAQAYAHDCTGCEAVASSFQAVVATGRPTTVTPSNLSVAVTYNCTSCKVFAYAYQYVVTADRPFRIREEDVRKVKAIKREAAEVTRSGLPYPELDARLQALAQRFREAIDTALARVRVRGHGEEHEHVEEHRG
jgi:putative peptide zinc metalloprotease protein